MPLGADSVGSDSTASSLDTIDGGREEGKRGSGMSLLGGKPGSVIDDKNSSFHSEGASVLASLLANEGTPNS